MHFQKIYRFYIFIIIFLLLFNINFLLSARGVKRKNIITVDNKVNSLAKARFALYFTNMSNAISWCIGYSFKSKPILIKFTKDYARFDPEINKNNNRITITVSKKYTDLLDKKTELKIINFLFLERFGLKASNKNISKISWITSAILKKFIFLEGSEALKSPDTFPIVYNLMLLDKNLKISQIVNAFPTKEPYNSPIYKLHEECSDILIHFILSARGGRSIINDYVRMICFEENTNCSKVLYKLLYKKLIPQNTLKISDRKLEEKIDKYLNQKAAKLVFNYKMPLPVQLSIKRFNNLCNVKCYMKVDKKIIEREVKLKNLSQNIEYIMNFNDVILYLITKLKILKIQSSYMVNAPLENII
ncbi:MAG TPA: hypothetical protein QF753_21265, partial [Victivallales bacterium]|nr:hypothetical protein [Victivallales bacterium]